MTASFPRMPQQLPRRKARPVSISLSLSPMSDIQNTCSAYLLNERLNLPVPFLQVIYPLLGFKVPKAKNNQVLTQQLANVQVTLSFYG